MYDVLILYYTEYYPEHEKKKAENLIHDNLHL